jgi:adenylate cyclase
MHRKLTAILSADVAGYSRLMGEDEEATIRTLTAYREVMGTLIQQHHGRVVDSPGDNLLAEFTSVVDAVRCAVEIQQTLQAKNAELPDQRRMEFRIGLNLGDVVVEGERLYGDGVNIAARLESLAEPGGICISGTAYDQVETKLSLTYEYLGEQTVKNIARPVRVWRVAMDEAAAALAAQGMLRQAQPSSPDEAKRNLGKTSIPGFRYTPSRLLLVVTLAGVLLMVGTILTVRYLSRPPLSTQSSALITQEALPLPDKPSIAVLPFTNLSGDPGQEYFSDGITETLTTDLSRLSGLFVIARNSAFTYKGKAVKVQDIGREMGVRYVLEGSVQKADQRVRITAQLIDATTSYHLWSERYDRELKDIFALQDEIVQKIVFALKVKLTPEEQERFRRTPTDNLEAYEYLLRGVESFRRYTKEANVQARQMFEKAIALDPQYAGAYAWLGWTYFNDGLFQWSPDPQQDLERAFALAQQARAMDNSLPYPHTLLSFIYLWGRNQPEQALAEGEQALALDPNNADSYPVLANVLSLIGRPEEAIEVAKKGVRLNPHYPTVSLRELGLAYLVAGRFEEAIATSQQALMHDPNYQFAYYNLAVSYLWQWVWQLSQDPQTLEHALAAAQKAVTLNDSLLWGHAALGSVYLWKKQPEQARAEAERAIALDPTIAEGYTVLAEVLNFAGRPAEAVGLAEKATRLSLFSWFLFDLGHAYYLSGRYEEAIATLKKLLTRTPYVLHAQLFLAIAYSESGREEEARAAVAEVLRINPKFSLEVWRQRVPYTDLTVIARQVIALRKAGLK